MRGLAEWLSHQERAHPQPIDLGLARLTRVLGRLGWARPQVPIITVAGTNGKGSVAAYATAILSASGLEVGTFTSPHLRDYRERIQLGGAWASSDSLIWAFERIEQACSGCGAPGSAADRISLTFFEYNALAALLIFEAAHLDAWVLEVGMGGRLDAVNVVDPSVAVVVSIGLDHQEFLGSTLEAIAREKAGIFRAAAPAVLGDRGMPGVLERIALEVGAPLKRLGCEYHLVKRGEGWRYGGPRWDLPDLPAPALKGEAQYRNAAAALAALEALPLADELGRTAISEGLRSVHLAARFQVIETAGPTFILDVAHNPAAASVLARNLQDMPGSGRTFAVCGILGDKDAAGVAAALAGCIDEWWLAPTEGVRGTSAAQLVARMSGGLGTAPVHPAERIAAACSAAATAARRADRIVIFGSFHTVGPAMDWLEAQGLLPRVNPREYTVRP